LTSVSSEVLGVSVFEVAVTAEAGRVVVEVSGDVDMLTAGRLREGLTEAIRVAGAGPVIVDLHRVPFLDSSGIQALLDGYHTAMVAGGTLTVRGAHGTVARVLQIVGIDRMLGVAPLGADPLDVAAAEPADSGASDGHTDPGTEPRPRELEWPGSS
jgi:anti-sigma B factor antagonist